MYEKQNQLGVHQNFEEILRLSPAVVGPFVPQNGDEQRELFLSGQIVNPVHIYDKLDSAVLVTRHEAIAQVGNNMLASPDMNPKFRGAYSELVETFQNVNQLLYVAAELTNATDAERRNQLKREYMRRNIELYGVPDEETYRSLLQEKLNSIDVKALNGMAADVRDELFGMANYDPHLPTRGGFAPREETVSWMHDMVTELYGGMLSRIPEQGDFTPQQLKAVFEDIIANEFAGSADDWNVVIEKASSVNVKAYEKCIVIPADKKDLTYDRVRELVVHEIGVHMLRSVMGGETNLPVLRRGLGSSADTEEGLAMVMQQALHGEFKRGGVDHYITAGAAYFDNMDFRKLFEMKWRIKAIEDLRKGQDLTDAMVQKAREAAYSGVIRSMRGTDELPWFKDLSYYNGPDKMWRYLESIRGDDIKFMFVLLGKSDPSNINHERLVYETSTI